jgi:1-acyl-sn-glycerol-3-phosphate acyltransferase
MSIHSVLVGVRSLFLIPFSIIVLAVTATVLLLLRTDERYINGPLSNRWARVVIWLAAAKVKVKGADKIPSIDESYIVVLNHQSNMDMPILIHSLPLQLRFVGKIELKKVPLFGSALIRAGHFLIDRKSHEKAMDGMRAVGEALRHRGLSVVFAPEGTRSPDGELMPFKKGAFVMAIETGIPILPVTIAGTRRSLAKGSLWTRGADVTVTIHEPVPAKDLTYEDRDKLADKVKNIMERTLRAENRE